MERWYGVTILIDLTTTAVLVYPVVDLEWLARTSTHYRLCLIGLSDLIGLSVCAQACPSESAWSSMAAPGWRVIVQCFEDV